MNEEYLLIPSILIILMLFFGIIEPSMCIGSGNCHTSLAFWLLGGIGVLLLIFSLLENKGKDGSRE